MGLDKNISYKDYYYSIRQVCPNCNGDKFSQTLTTYFIQMPGDMDKNKVECSCGWQGTVHDLKPTN